MSLSVSTTGFAVSASGIMEAATGACCCCPCKSVPSMRVVMAGCIKCTCVIGSAVGRLSWLYDINGTWDLPAVDPLLITGFGYTSADCVWALRVSVGSTLVWREYTDVGCTTMNVTHTDMGVMLISLARKADGTADLFFSGEDASPFSHGEMYAYRAFGVLGFTMNGNCDATYTRADLDIIPGCGGLGPGSKLGRAGVATISPTP